MKPAQIYLHTYISRFYFLLLFYSIPQLKTKNSDPKAKTVLAKVANLLLLSSKTQQSEQAKPKE